MDLSWNAPELAVIFDGDAEVSSLGVAHLGPFFRTDGEQRESSVTFKCTYRFHTSLYVELHLCFLPVFLPLILLNIHVTEPTVIPNKMKSQR